MPDGPDPRLTPVREDLAAAHLKGVVDAPRYAVGQEMQVCVPVLDMMGRADPAAPLTNQLLYGESFTVFDIDESSGLAWGQAAIDGYVGYVPAEGLRPKGPAPAMRVTSLGCQIYAETTLKARPSGWLPHLAQFSGNPGEDGYIVLSEGGYVPAQNVAPCGTVLRDWVAEAERYLGLPYVWGGRSCRGLDCSALIQLAAQAAGQVLPRDSDMQEAEGSLVNAPLQRGDLVFWKGHVGVMRDGETLLHANAHPMAVVSEPLAEVEDRIAATPDGPVTSRRRLPW